MRKSMVILAASAAILGAIPAAAASVDYFLEIDGIKGESSAADKGHKDWIELSSLHFQGGVRVATGDIDGDGAADSSAPRDAASGMATGKRQHKPMTITKELDRTTSPAGPTDVSSGDSDPQAIGLLLPAVQKVREASARLPKGATCTVGKHFDSGLIREGEDGAVHRISDITVTACQGETFSLNFTKVES